MLIIVIRMGGLRPCVMRHGVTACSYPTAVSPILSVWLSAHASSQTAVNVHSSLVRPMNAKLPSSRVTSSNVRGQPGVAA